MIWMYAMQGKQLSAIDITSLKELNDFCSNVDWCWIDIFHPDEKEAEIISELLGNEPKIVEDIKKETHNPSRVHPMYEKLHDYVLLSIPSVTLEERLRICPIFMIVKNKMLITWGEEKEHGHSMIIKSTIRRFREHAEEGGELNSSLAIGMLFREIAFNNSEVMLSIRELIDQIEEKSLKEAGEKRTVYSIFSLKRQISTFHRLLITEKEIILDIDETMIPRIVLDEKAKPIVGDAIEDINRQLDFVDSYNRSLDSILTLQNLTSIHRVESSINYLTIILVIGTVILIILEILGKFGLTSGAH
ncbi:MAG: hypothetical protein JSV29_06365 [Candidatus Bathyarchaeota archaeon]|nr:MAG: hypothetical protein JSV29_06365 [Candidatus Bathyarchaeota archaeon]